MSFGQYKKPTNSGGSGTGNTNQTEGSDEKTGPTQPLFQTTKRERRMGKITLNLKPRRFHMEKFDDDVGTDDDRSVSNSVSASASSYRPSNYRKRMGVAPSSALFGRQTSSVPEEEDQNVDADGDDEDHASNSVSSGAAAYTSFNRSRQNSDQSTASRLEAENTYRNILEPSWSQNKPPFQTPINQSRKQQHFKEAAIETPSNVYLNRGRAESKENVFPFNVHESGNRLNRSNRSTADLPTAVKTSSHIGRSSQLHQGESHLYPQHQHHNRSHSQPPPTTPREEYDGASSRSSRPRQNPDESLNRSTKTRGDLTMPTILAMTPFEKARRQNGQDQSHHQLHQSLLSSTKKKGQNEDEVMFVKGQPYAILKVIGKGGSSVVYEVYDEERNLKAIKKVDLSEAGEAEAKGYLNEINMLEKLQGHHRIVKMYDYEYDEKGELLYVVMERGDVDLSTHLKRMNQNQKENAQSQNQKVGMNANQRKFYWSEMLEAVQAIHENGIIHSDLKPANFLIIRGTLKLIDFGIASSVQSDETSVIKDTQMGTFNFMSPEVIEDLSGSSTDDGEDFESSEGYKPKIKISRKSDVWSLGCILYNMTYGKMPFGDIRIPFKKLEAIVNPKHKIPYPNDPSLDPALVDTIKRCLVRDVKSRASVDELLSHQYLSGINGSSASSTSVPSKNLASQLNQLSELESVLTPNTRRVLSKVADKLSASDLASLKLQ